MAARYKSVWPPLYHSLVSIPFILVGDSGPTSLKTVGDSPRRIIPTNGHTIATTIHTEDEAWPWRGLPLAWHLGRMISALLMAGSVTTTFFLAWYLTRQAPVALLAVTIQAFIPQVLFLGGIINDDSMLILISELTALLLIWFIRQQQQTRDRISALRVYFGVGILLGLGTITKYNVWALFLIVTGFLLYELWVSIRPLPSTSSGDKATLAEPVEGGWTPLILQLINQTARRVSVMFIGWILVSGWWFAFIWYHFNQISTMGWLRGSLESLVAGTSDATIQELSRGSKIIIPSLEEWLTWIRVLFYSFWGLFGGGGAVEMATWVYAVLAGAVLFGLGWLIFCLRSNNPALQIDGLQRYFLLTPLFCIILPILRFILSGNIVETSQGRHLSPALSAVVIGLALGINGLRILTTKLNPRLRYGLGTTLLIAYLLLPLHGLNRISASYPPLITLRTTENAYPVEVTTDLSLTEDGVNLVGYRVSQDDDQLTWIELVWRATDIPTQDYLVEVTVTADDEVFSHWVGHPLGGRYPTRAWDDGDWLRNRIPLPTTAPVTEGTLHLQLLDSQFNPFTEQISLGTISLSKPNTPLTPQQLRTDQRTLDAPFGYRNTITLNDSATGQAMSDTVQLVLLEETGRKMAESPNRRIAESLNQFIVEADWPNGYYGLAGEDVPLVRVANRQRQFELPLVSKTSRPVQANFADQLTLLSYDLPQRQVQAGQTFPLTLSWRAERTMGQNMVIFHHLLDAQQVKWGGEDRVPQKYYNTLLWVPREIVHDSYDVPINEDAPDGIYWLHVGVYPSTSPQNSLQLVENRQTIDQTSVRLGPIKVGEAPSGLTIVHAEPEQTRQIQFDEQIELIGFDYQITTRKIKLYWRSLTAPHADYNLFLHILDADNQLVGQVDGPPAPAYPTSLWSPGEIIPDERQLPELSAGQYTIKMGLYRLDTGMRLPTPEGTDGALTLMTIEQ